MDKNRPQFTELRSSYEPMFWNVPLDKSRLKNFVSWFLKNHGEKKTLLFLEQLKILGFGYATKAGISLGIEDLKIPPSKAQLLAEAQFRLIQSNLSYRKGETTGIEKVQRFIETWNETSENLKQEVVRYFEKTDMLNPVYMMAFSGARGNLSQVRQLVGMRGLMSDPQGKIIDFPIQSNFREGLTLTEYLISTYGARKGIVDTALRTATAGYLTRRLVDVAQHVIVSKFDCGTQRGIFVFDMKEGLKTIYSFQNRLIGRVLAETILKNPQNPESDQNPVLAYRNQEVTPELAEAISKITKKALVRSPLTCETRKLVCQLCYGWSLATSKLVSIGETVGVIAGQSIGEPGTQLTMRTFHTGGVFAANVAQQMNAPFFGKVEYGSPIAGTCIRTPNGQIAFFTKSAGILFLKKQNPTQTPSQEPDSLVMNTYKIPAFTILFARHGEFVEKDSILAQISAVTSGQTLTQTIEQTIYSSFEGEVYYNQIDILEDIDDKYSERISKAEDWSKVWVLSAKILQNQFSSPFFPKVGDFVSKSSVLNQVQWTFPTSQKSLLSLGTTQPTQSRKFALREYSPLLKNQPISTASNPVSFQNSTNEKEKPFPRSFQVLSKYGLSQKFSNPKLNLSKTKEAKHGPISKTFSFKNGTKTVLPKKNLESMPTVFFYPYAPLIRANSLKIVKQTFVSLPVLSSGFLQTWLKTQPSMKKPKTMAPLSNALTKSSVNHFIKKLNLNPRFRSYNSLKANLFHPLILSNLIPFCLEETTLQSWLIRQKQKNRPVSFKNPEEFQSVIQMNLKETESSLKSAKSSKAPPTFSLMSMQTPKSQKAFKAESFTGHKFENLSLKTPFLLLKMTDLNYSKFGYFATLGLNARAKEHHQFISLLPLKNAAQVPFNQKTLYNTNQEKEDLHSFYQKVNPSNTLNPLNLYGLKNSYQWNPPSLNSFFWLPQSKNERPKTGRGLICVENVDVVQKSLYKKMLQSSSKSIKTTNLNSTKYLNLLNLSHSQIARKSRNLKKSDLVDKLDQKMYKRQNVQHVGGMKFNARASFSLDKKTIGLNMPTFKAPVFDLRRPAKAYANNVRRFTFPLFSEHSSDDMKKMTELKMSFSQKKRLAPTGSKELREQATRRKSLILKVKSDEKNAMDYHEFHWIPEENYCFECFSESSALRSDLGKKDSRVPGHPLKSQQKALFFAHTGPLNSNQKDLKWYQTNAQGLKKPMVFESEGLLQIQELDPMHNLFLKRSEYDLSIEFQKKEPLHLQNRVNLEKAELKMQFLKHLKNSKRPTKEGQALKHANLIVKPRILKPCFTFIPYFKKKGLKDTFSKFQTLEKFDALKPFQTKSKLMKLTVKPGWIYKTFQFESVMHSAKQMVQAGKQVVDDVSFDQHRVFIEKISLSPKIPELNAFAFSKTSSLESSKTVQVSRFIENKKPRFLNEKMVKCLNAKTGLKQPSVHFLIRPCYYKMTETSSDLKICLQNAMQKTRLKNFESSVSYYKQFFETGLNPQNRPLKTLSQFPTPDLEVQAVETGSFVKAKASKKEFSVRKASKSSVKILETKNMLKVKKSKILNSLTLEYFEQRLNPKPQVKQGSKHLDRLKPKNAFYFSNVPRHFEYYEVCLKPASPHLKETFTNTLAFQSTELQNSMTTAFSKTGPVKMTYLNLLILRSELERNPSRESFKNRMNGFKESPLLDPESRVARTGRTFGLKSFLASFKDLPFFEYSLQKNYNFFANQRLFASSFYKYQFKEFLQVPVLNNLLLNQEMFRSRNFIQKFAEQHNFATSFHEYPFLKNYLILKNHGLGSSSNDVMGFTNFYSRYEGEILKDYANEQDSWTLKKGFNVAMDKANLIERQNQQLMLTKDDLISLHFERKSHFKNSVKKRLKSPLKAWNEKPETRGGENRAETSVSAERFFKASKTKRFFDFLVYSNQSFQRLEKDYFENLDLKKYEISEFKTHYKNKNYLLKKVQFGLPNKEIRLRLGTFMNCGDFLYSNSITAQPGQIIHLNSQKITLRKAEFFSISPKTILHTYNGHCLPKNSAVMTLPFETLKTGDIVQGIPKVEQYLEARTTIQGRLFLNSLPVLLYAIYRRYSGKLEMEKAVRQSFLKIQQILVDGVQRVYRSQGVSIADKHLEIIVRQMTSKVKIIHGGQTGFVAGELVDLEFVERINTMLMIKIRYEPVVLGITRASLEVDSFLSAASFQQTTKVLTRSALENKKDFLKGLKENLLVGNLLPAGTGYVLPIL